MNALRYFVYPLLCAVLTGCSTNEHLKNNEEIKCIEFDKKSQQLCSINTQNGVVWYYFSIKNNTAIALNENQQPYSEFYISEIHLSPNEKYIAFISASEGHPALTIFDLQSLINLDNPIKQIVIADYPHDISFVGWEDNQLIYEMYYNDDGEKRDLDSEQFKLDFSSVRR